MGKRQLPRWLWVLAPPVNKQGRKREQKGGKRELAPLFVGNRYRSTAIIIIFSTTPISVYGIMANWKGREKTWFDLQMPPTASLFFGILLHNFFFLWTLIKSNVCLFLFSRHFESAAINLFFFFVGGGGEFAHTLAKKTGLGERKSNNDRPFSNPRPPRRRRSCYRSCHFLLPRWGVNCAKKRKKRHTISRKL